MATGLPCYKIVLCGEYGVGKSSLFRRFIDNSFTTDTGPRSTVGLDHISKEFTCYGRQIKLELWDTAGIERFATLSSSYFQSASAAIICYSVDNRESFNMLSQHILEAIMHSETVKVFMCGNKTDVPCDDPVTDSDVDELRVQCDTMLNGCYRVSCKTGDGVKEMFQDIANIVLKEATHKFDPSKVRPHEDYPPPEEKSKCCS